ncbi:hypothetical protein NBM05_07345 [Rothia sp. AR01]|uniref:TrbL/VirB6 plasmid conjugal transfer protein n=1 Tax=Rothia santali TaxID=2949643 RepID=A0A9X2HCX8_9MICC|nr:type IV secretion system protein [Rothia santali]MCP3425825.1 hypothetical protein [Rothia santali]
MAFDFKAIFDDSGESFFGVIENFAVQANQFLVDAFSASDVDESWWAAVLGTASNDGVLMMWMPVVAPMIVLLVALQVVLSVFRGSSIGLARAACGAFFGIPMTYIMVWIVQMFTAGMDEVAAYILDRGGDQNMAVFMRIFGIQITDGKLTGIQENYFMWQGVMDKSGGWVLIVPLLLMFLIWGLSLVLGFVMALRSMGIIILSSLAGWAVSSLAFEVTKSWFGSWLKIVVGLGLAKPFAAGLIVLSSTVFNYADSGMQFAAGMAGLVLAIAMPFAAVSFVSFTAAGAVSGQEQSLGRAANAPIRGLGRGAGALSRLRKR